MSSSESMFRLDGKTVVLTGASSGLGARFVHALADAGANVVAAACRVERVVDVAQGRSTVFPVRCDVTSEVDRTALVEVARNRFGRIDVLVNNAGVTGDVSPAELQSSAAFRAVLATNLEAAFALSTGCFEDIARQGGSIINVASILGLVASAPFNQAAYCASKAGLIGLTRELAVEWARREVRVNALAPGYFASEGTDALMADEASRKWIERNCPMGRIGGEGELDGALIYLASAASTYMTGQVLVVDGGWTAR